MRALARAISCFFTIEAIVLVVLFAALVGCRAFGFECYDILTNSMAPSMPAGTLVWVQTNIDPTTLESGDVVAYRAASGAAVTHRVVGNDTDGCMLTTKGDVNEIADAPVSYSAVIGRSAACLPYAGAAFNSFMSSKWEATALLVGANAVLLTAYEFMRRISRRRAGGDSRNAAAKSCGQDPERNGV